MLSELTESKTTDRTRIQTVIERVELLFARKVHALELVKQRDISQITVFAASDQVSCALHIRVILTAIETNHMWSFRVPTSLSEKPGLHLTFLEQPHLDRVIFI